MPKSSYAIVDEQGHLVLPVELSQKWNLAPGQKLRVLPDGHDLTLRPPVTSLRRIYVELTNGCNLNCSTCMRNVWDEQTGCISRDTFDRVLQGAVAFQPLPELFFGGYGEPLSHPSLLENIARAKSLGFRVSLITNGTLLTKDISESLIQLDLDWLWVSIDGATPECFADVRLGNALPLILENLKTLHRLQYQHNHFSTWSFRPRLGIAFVAMQRNLADLPQVINLGVSLGAVEFSITNVLAHTAELRQECLYTRSLNEVGDRNANLWKPLVRMPVLDVNRFSAEVLINLLKGDQRLSLFGSELRGTGDRCPFVERGSLAVRWDGKVSPCLPLLYTHTQYLDDRLRTTRQYFVGDLGESSLPAIWNGAAYVELRESLDDFGFSPCVICNSCEMADQNLEDCFGNIHPTCGACLWAQGLIRCP